MDNQTNNTTKATQFSPNLKAYILSTFINLVIGLILFLIVLTIVLSIIGFNLISIIGAQLITVIITILFSVPFIIYGNIMMFLAMRYTTYSITDNEIIIEKNFISKEKNVYRIDQITSITRTQNFIQKIFCVSTIRFSIFGEKIVVDKNGKKINLKEFTYVNDNLSIFEDLFISINDELRDTSNRINYFESPKISPAIASLCFNISISIIALISSIVFKNTTEIYFVLLGIFFLFILSSIISFISIFRIKRTKYNIYSDRFEYTYNYIFSNYNFLIPKEKITNTSTQENAISASLFNIYSSMIFTGGTGDFKVKLLDKSKNFLSNLNQLLKNEKTNQTTKNENSNSSKDENIKLNNNAIDIFKPGITYLVPMIINISIAITILLVSLLFSFYYTIALSCIFLLISSFQYIYFKRLNYEFYRNRIVVQSGIILTKREEIYFENIKYLKLTYSFPFEKIAKQGTIEIHSAGSSNSDLVIRNIKKSREVYEKLNKIIIKD